MKGYINSIQSLGTLDGPGIRFVAFLQGCNLRCGCCHNPDTWALGQGEVYSAIELVDNAQRFREYYKEDGGITLSGGEPLLQPEFACEVFKECKKRNINTCLDTSGSILNSKVIQLFKYTDRVLLDIKFTTDEMYKEYVGCSMDEPLKFLEYLNQEKIPVTLRQVLIPTLNDNEENINRLSSFAKKYPCVDKTELLPFRKICKAKYDNLKIKFRFDDIPEPTKEDMEKLEPML
ncbi:MAG: pyruvate formate-lyase-activating protein [Eubacteriales bacterium]|nr:pyruvate formate-lyase-activating protein [Eubacteriales bacterium]